MSGDAWMGLGFGGLIVLIVGVFAMAIVGENKQAQQWEAFRTTHACRVTQTMPGETFTTFGADGKIGMGSTSAKQAWLCNDGVTYWRSK